MIPEPSDSFATKARHLRRIFRQAAGSYAAVRPEFVRLFPRGDAAFEPILQRAWVEGRELAGWRYDRSGQAWIRADGTRVVDDDGREWRHL